MADFEYQQPRKIRQTNRQREETKKQNSGSSGGIPDRWLNYLGVHKSVDSTRFVPFKCPLKPEMQQHLPEDRRFTFADLVEQLDNQGKELGLIIDLTYTDRYYKASDIIDAKIEYFKLMTPGHNKVPNETCYQSFSSEVKKFLQANRQNDKLIGVHCTHGLNRTGYLIVRYMIDEMNIDPNEALEAFNRARGHSMEKYTEDLLKRRENCTTTNSISTSKPITNDNNNDSQWPSLYLTMEQLSLSEGRKQKQRQSKSQITPKPIQGEAIEYVNDDQIYRENSKIDFSDDSSPVREHDQRQASRPTDSNKLMLNSTMNEKQPSIRTTATFFGSGSNVGRGRPLTNDR